MRMLKKSKLGKSLKSMTLFIFATPCDACDGVVWQKGNSLNIKTSKINELTAFKGGVLNTPGPLDVPPKGTVGADVVYITPLKGVYIRRLASLRNLFLRPLVKLGAPS